MYGYQGGSGGGMNWEIGIVYTTVYTLLVYTLLYILHSMYTTMYKIDNS